MVKVSAKKNNLKKLPTRYFFKRKNKNWEGGGGEGMDNFCKFSYKTDNFYIFGEFFISFLSLSWENRLQTFSPQKCRIHSNLDRI